MRINQKRFKKIEQMFADGSYWMDKERGFSSRRLPNYLKQYPRYYLIQFRRNYGRNPSREELDQFYKFKRGTHLTGVDKENIKKIKNPIAKFLAQNYNGEEILRRFVKIYGRQPENENEIVSFQKNYPLYK